jgi:hypothetical protein
MCIKPVPSVPSVPSVVPSVYETRMSYPMDHFKQVLLVHWGFYLTSPQGGGGREADEADEADECTEAAWQLLLGLARYPQV